MTQVEHIRAGEILEAEDYGVDERSVYCQKCNERIGPSALFREERAFSKSHQSHGSLMFRTFYDCSRR